MLLATSFIAKGTRELLFPSVAYTVLAVIFGIILLTFLIIFTIVQVFHSGESTNPYVLKIFMGINAAVTALLFVATYKMMQSVIKTKFAAFIAVASFIGIITFNLDISTVVISAAFISLIYHSLLLSKEAGK